MQSPTNRPFHQSAGLKSPRDKTKVKIDGKPLDSSGIKPIPVPRRPKPVQRTTDRGPRNRYKPQDSGDPDVITPSPPRHEIKSNPGTPTRTLQPGTPKHAPAKAANRQITPRRPPSPKPLSAPRTDRGPATSRPGSVRRTTAYPVVSPKQDGAPEPTAGPRVIPTTIPVVSPKKEVEDQPKVQIQDLPHVTATNDGSEPDFDNMTQTQLDAWNAHLDINFMTLTQYYPEYFRGQSSLPTSTTDVRTKYKLYKLWFNHITRSNNSSNYKALMILWFVAIEVFFTKFLKLNMGGYAVAQIRSFNKYQSLLMELGERSYLAIDSNYPVEIRILMISLFQALIFWVINFMMSFGAIGAFGVSIVEALTGTSASPPPVQQEVQQNQGDNGNPNLAEPPAPPNPLLSMFNGEGIVNTLTGLANTFLGGGNRPAEPVEP